MRARTRACVCVCVCACMCVFQTCPDQYFDCQNDTTVCIHRLKRCDCVKDCTDGSDESVAYAGCVAEYAACSSRAGEPVRLSVGWLVGGCVCVSVCLLVSLYLLASLFADFNVYVAISLPSSGVPRTQKLRSPSAENPR